MGAPIYISLTSKRTYVSIVALVSEFQDNMDQTRPKISPGTLQQICNFDSLS